MISITDWVIEQAANQVYSCLCTDKRPDDVAMSILVDAARRNIAKNKASRAIDLDELWEVVASLEKSWPIDNVKHGKIPLEDVYLFEQEMAPRIRKAIGK